MGNSDDHHDDLRFPNRSGRVMNCPTSAMSTSPFFASAWDPIVSLSSHENFGGSSVVVSQSEFNNSPYPVVIDHQGISGASQITTHYPSDSSLVEMVPKFPCYGSGSFSEMVGSYGMNQCGQIGSSGCPPNYALNKAEDNIGRIAVNDAQCQEDHHQLIDEGALRASPNGKRKKRVAESNSSFDPSKNADEELQNDHSNESSDALKEQDEKKQKTEAGTNVRGKSASKQGKDSSNSGEAPKEYIHVRARRGQATNSHSLAERVRREKISERMRLLQELVPGCNKITGKAVMLDEIINYVQSLQQQVEFLSMKLATVNPELNIDLERLLSKDILHSRGSNASILGFNPGMNMNAYSNGLFQPGISAIPSAAPQLPLMPQTVLENEMHSLFQLGYDSNPGIDSFGSNGRLKLELQNLEKMKGFNS